MSEYTVAHLDEIDEMTDGRAPWRPIRHHLGITSFGVNAYTGRDAGDRIINEHDETNDLSEELYIVQRGHARFELDGERVDAPAGTLVFARPGVKRTAFAEQPGTTIIALGGTPGKAYEPQGYELWAPLHPLYEAGQYAEVADRARELIEAHPELSLPALQPRLLREPGRTESRRDRAPPARHRPGGTVAPDGCRRLGLRSDPRRAGIQAAGGSAGVALPVHRLTKAQARRIAVRAQLLDAPRPTDLVAVVQQLTLLQIDPTAAIAPSADLVAWSRLGSAYRPAHLQQALEQDRTLFEHNALVRPMSDLGLYLAGAAGLAQP